MISFAWPWILFFLPLPWLVRRFFPPAPPYAETALKVPFFNHLIKLADNAARLSPPATRKIQLLAGLIWLLLVMAAMRPQWPGDPIELPSGRDLLIAVDISKSMARSEVGLAGKPADQLSVVKQVVGEFILRRQGDRVGLILYSERPYLQVPLTYDVTTVKTFLEQAFIAMITGKSTAIGDAIGLAIKRLREQPSQNRVLILITDGNNNAGEVEPLKAAQWAAELGLRIYTIGLAADKMQIDTPSGSRYVTTSFQLDEKTLQEMAKQTGGRYFRAYNGDELKNIHQQLDQLEPIQKQLYNRKIELYPLPLIVAFFLSFLLVILRVK